MCPLLALPIPRAFLLQPLTVLTRQARQVVRAINQSIFLRCLWMLESGVSVTAFSLSRIKSSRRFVPGTQFKLSPLFESPG